MSIDKKKASSSYLYGLTSEVLVAEYLVANGYAVLENRYRTPYGELDLIATKKGILIFCEVKARKKANVFCLISERQKLRNTNAALFFLSQSQEYVHYEARFDFFLVLQDRIEMHIENAWECHIDLAV